MMNIPAAPAMIEFPSAAAAVAETAASPAPARRSTTRGRNWPPMSPIPTTKTPKAAARPIRGSLIRSVKAMAEAIPTEVRMPLAVRKPARLRPVRPALTRSHMP